VNEILEEISNIRINTLCRATNHERRNFIPHRLGPKSTSIELKQGVSNLLPTCFKFKKFYTQAEQMDDRHHNPKSPPPTVNRQGFDS
jgi:hypothetical protein